MRLSDSKMNHLSHVLIKALAKLPDIEFPRGQNNARLRILTLIQEGAKAEEQLHERIHQKIASGKKTIPEGSREWEILFRRYYEEEISRLMPPASGRER